MNKIDLIVYHNNPKTSWKAEKHFKLSCSYFAVKYINSDIVYYCYIQSTTLKKQRFVEVYNPSLPDKKWIRLSIASNEIVPIDTVDIAKYYKEIFKNNNIDIDFYNKNSQYLKFCNNPFELFL